MKSKGRERRFGRAATVSEGVPTLKGRHRVLVVGAGGAGKSTLARELAAVTGLPVVHLDRHYWRRGWSPAPAGEWGNVVARLVEADRWIIDGNYTGSLQIRLSRCDAVVFLDLPRWVCLWGVLKRRMRFAGKQRPDLAEGCPERLPLEFLWWIWRYPQRSRHRVLAALEGVGSEVAVIRLGSRRAARELLESMRRMTDHASRSACVETNPQDAGRTPPAAG